MIDRLVINNQALAIQRNARKHSRVQQTARRRQNVCQVLAQNSSKKNKGIWDLLQQTVFCAPKMGSQGVYAEGGGGGGDGGTIALALVTIRLPLLCRGNY